MKPTLQMMPVIMMSILALPLSQAQAQERANTVPAAGSACACWAGAGADAVTLLSRIEGSVRVSRAAGYEPGRLGQSLPVNTRLLVAANSQVEISRGACRLLVGPGQAASIVSRDAGSCISLAENGAVAPSPQAGPPLGIGPGAPPPPSAGIASGLFGTVLGFTGAAVFEKNEKVSD